MYTLKVKYSDSDVPKISMPNHGDWGIDLYANETKYIPLGQNALVDTGISIELPEGFASMIKDRSGKSKFFHVLAGIIDNSYTGIIKVRLFNHGYDPLKEDPVFKQYSFQPEYVVQPCPNVKKGERIAQLLILPDYCSQFCLEEVNEIRTTDRGDKGFGSTGV